ncbi:MAG: hypothetical protein Hens3KO_15440 [Henriciella sp.]
MTPILSGLSLYVTALAIMLSAMIRLIQSGQLRARVDAGFTGVRELAELSGIRDARELQDVFGPPGMERIWRQVTVAQIERKRRLPGYLMSDPRLHWTCIGIGFLAFLTGHWSIQLGLILAALAQLGGWISAAQLPK